MNFKNLVDLENTVLKTGNNGEYTFTPFSIPVKNEKLVLKGLFTTPKNRSKYYYDVVHPKERIVLHFTAGQIRSDLQALTGHERHVSVAFVIGRNGIIYQLFPSKFWSGHIGKGIGNTNTGNAQDKVSIGIELSNYGYLVKRNENLETYYSLQKDANGRTGPVDVYCSVNDAAAYTQITTPFRGQTYYANHTDEQYDSLIVLLRYLTTQFNIPRQFLPEPVRYQSTEEVLKFKGIVSHINYRVDGKWDIGPGFDWKKMISGVQAQTFTPLSGNLENTGDEDFENAGGLHSEDQFKDLLPEAESPLKENEPYEEEVPL